MTIVPKSFCNLKVWINHWPHGFDFDRWTDTVPESPSTKDFWNQFDQLVMGLGGTVKSLPDDLSLEEAKAFAHKLSDRLIIEKREVPDGWTDVFKFAVPGFTENFVSFPPHPIRSAHDVVEFMDGKDQLANKTCNTFRVIVPDYERSCLEHGIKGALVWLIANKHNDRNALRQEIPTDIVVLKKLFDSLRQRVQSLDFPLNSLPPEELLDEIPGQGAVILKHLWNCTHGQSWDYLPEHCWRSRERPTNDQTVTRALERLADKLNKSYSRFRLRLEIQTRNRRVRLVRDTTKSTN